MPSPPEFSSFKRSNSSSSKPSCGLTWYTAPSVVLRDAHAWKRESVVVVVVVREKRGRWDIQKNDQREREWETRNKKRRAAEKEKKVKRAHRPSSSLSVRFLCACVFRVRDDEREKTKWQIRLCCVREKGEKIFLKNATREFFEIKRSQRERERERERSRISHARYI